MQVCSHMPLPLQVLILENVRFYKEETKNDPEFAKKVGRHPCAGLSDIMRQLDGVLSLWTAQVTCCWCPRHKTSALPGALPLGTWQAVPWLTTIAGVLMTPVAGCSGLGASSCSLPAPQAHLGKMHPRQAALCLPAVGRQRRHLRERCLRHSPQGTRLHRGRHQVPEAVCGRSARQNRQLIGRQGTQLAPAFS